MSLACACVGAPLALAGAAPRRDSDGQQCCELCVTLRRLTRCKLPLHKHGAGKICDPCYKALLRPAAASAALTPSAAPAAATASTPPAAPPRSHKRARSDPGEPTRSQHLGTQAQAVTRRIIPPKPTAVKKQRLSQKEQRIMRMLDETVARREVAEATAQH